jgi:DNA polymerase III subunit epsilon
MREIEFAVVDVETTGLSPAFGDRVCEIAVAHFRGGQEVFTFTTLVNPERPLSPSAAAVNGITAAMVARAPLFRDIAAEIAQQIGGRVFVAHNVPFDLGFLVAEFQRLRLAPPIAQVIDTLALARQYYTFPSNSLGAIADQLNIPYPRRHRALQDARITGQILHVFLHDLTRRRNAAVENLVAPVTEALLSSSGEASSLPPILDEALTNGFTLEIRYVSAGSEVSTRRIDPLAVVPNRDYLYLRAYCHLRQGERTFRLDRIVEMRLVGKSSKS